MPTTTYTDTTISLRNIGARTDFAGAGVTDLSAEEDRFSHQTYREGAISDGNAFLPAAGAPATMNVVIGSGSAKADYYLVAGEASGQGNYLARLDDATKTLTLAAADPTNPRIDEVYLVVRDNAYDSTGRALASLAVRKGDAAASPSAPGVDAAWKASALLVTVDVPAAAADIDACTLTDERVASAYQMLGDDVITRDLAESKTIVAAPSGDTISLEIAGTSEASLSATTLDLKGNTITNVGAVDGVDISTHAHTGGADGTVIAHSSLSGLGTGDPHTQYVLESAHTKADHDALAIDAATADTWSTGRSFTLTGDVTGTAAGVDGSANVSIATTVADDSHSHSTYVTTASHTKAQHDAFGIDAATADTWSTGRTFTLSGDVTGSAVGVDGSANVTITTTVANDSHTHSNYYLSANHTKATHDALGIVAATADAWTTGRTITLTGDVSGSSAAWDGSTNISFATTVADDSHSHSNYYEAANHTKAIHDALAIDAGTAATWATGRTFTLSGDVTGSAVGVDGSANVTITTTVGNDSHTHDTRYFTESEANANFLGISATAAAATKWATGRTITLSGDVTGTSSVWDGTGNATLTATVANDSHTHDTRYYTESEANTNFVNVSGDTMTGNLTVNSANGIYITKEGSETRGLYFQSNGGTNYWNIEVDNLEQFVIWPGTGADIDAFIVKTRWTAGGGLVSRIAIDATGSVQLRDSNGAKGINVHGTGSGLSIWSDFTDVGNVEVLRSVRNTGSPTHNIVGYYSSLRSNKEDIVDLLDDETFDLDLVDRMQPVSYTRKSTGGREWGFILQGGEEEDQDSDLGILNPQLTTNGNEIGGSPDELALIATLVATVKDLRARVAELEGK